MKYSLFTDGACQPNPGQGGWAFVAYPTGYANKQEAQSGYEESTTNNRMELTAFIQGLKLIIGRLNPDSEHNEVLLVSDSKYLINGIDLWMEGWVKNSWTKKKKKPLINVDLWKEIYHLIKQLNKITCQHIKGHSGHLENEQCDKMAVEQIGLHKTCKNKNTTKS